MEICAAGGMIGILWKFVPPRAWWSGIGFFILTPEGSHVYCHFALCDNKCFYCTILSLAEQMFSLYHCAPCGLKCYKRVTPRGSGVGFWGNLCRQEHDGPLGSVFFVSWPQRGHMSLAFWSLAAQNVSMYLLVPGGKNSPIINVGMVCAVNWEIYLYCKNQDITMYYPLIN